MSSQLNSRIPSRLRPPTKLEAFTFKQPLQPVSNNIPKAGPPPGRSALSRRSKSALCLKNDQKPTTGLRVNGALSRSNTNLLRDPPKFTRQGSVKALTARGDAAKAAETKPITTRSGTIKPWAVRPALSRTASTEAVPTQPTSSSSRAGLKRGAITKPEDQTKPKVAKPMKPAPYDYKARYGLEVEKCTVLRKQCKDNEEILKNAQQQLDELIELKEKYSQLFEDHQTLLEETSELQEDRGKLKRLETNFEKLQKDHEDAVSEIATLEEYAHILENEKEQLSLKAEELIKVKAENQRLVRDLKDVSSEKSALADELTKVTKKNEYLQKSKETYKNAYKEGEEQSRILRNMVQDLKGNIRVFCRVRPPKTSESDKLPCRFTFNDEASLEIRQSRESFSVSGRPVDMKQDFTFDRVFPPEASQAEVFEDLAQLVQSALDGYHVCVFAYGQTGSGKTYTMQGELRSNCMGMIPRSIKLLFKRINELSKLGWTYTVQCSFLEIYNESIKDLLDPDTRSQYEIRHLPGKGTIVTNLTTKPVTSTESLLDLMHSAQRHRAVAVTDFNEHSSRSHFVAKISIEGTNSESEALYIGSLNLVDLAGSESAKTTHHDRLNETKNINKSLSSLGNVMHALQNKDSHIPYRNSKLTYLLQACLGGNSKTLMIVNIAPFEDSYNESINSLRFGAKVKEVKTGSKRNKVYNK